MRGRGGRWGGGGRGVRWCLCVCAMPVRAVPPVCAGAPPPLPLSGHGCVSSNLSLCLSSLPPLVELLPLPRWSTSSGYRAPPLARRARGHECAVRVHVRRGSSDGTTCRSVSRSGVAHVCGVRRRAPWHPGRRALRTAPLCKCGGGCDRQQLAACSTTVYHSLTRIPLPLPLRSVCRQDRHY